MSPPKWLRARRKVLVTPCDRVRQLLAQGAGAHCPGLTTLATPADSNEAIKIAEDVVAWAQTLVP
jgi:hypothetical protein